MADFVTKDGREIDFDFEVGTIKEYRKLFEKDTTQEESDEILARMCGLTVDELTGLNPLDYRKLLKAFLKKASSPLDDPS